MLAEAKQIDGIDAVFAWSPPGNVTTMARLIVRGIAKGTTEIVYPRPMWLGRLFPSFGRWMGAWMMRKMRAQDGRLVAGGSTGAKEAVDARNAFDEKRAA